MRAIDWSAARMTLCLLAAPQSAPDQGTDPPPFRTMRHEEDYAYLKDASRRSDPLDPIKYIPLSGYQKGWFLSLGGEVRERFEYFDNAQWDRTTGSDGFLLQRYMFSTDMHLGPRFRLFTHMKSGLKNGSEAGPRPADEDRLDLHEAFIDLGLGVENRLGLRLGRQELSFGSQRLVSIRNGPNVRQSFDGVDLIARPGPWRVDVFGTKPVETEAGVFDDNADHTRKLWGVYAVGPITASPSAHVDLYYLGLDRESALFDQGLGAEHRHSLGARFWQRAGAWDYDFEVVYQGGRFDSAPIRAWTVASDTGLTLEDAVWRPRFGLKADVTSGDRDPNAPTLQSFNPLFPRGAYFGESGLIGPVNHIDLHPSVDLRPTRWVTVTPSWDFFWRQSLRDGLYGVAVNLVRSGQGTRARYVGSQAGLMVKVVLNRHMTIVTDFEYFDAGPFLRESGPGDDVTYVTTWVSYLF